VRGSVAGFSPRGVQNAGAQSGSQYTRLLAGMIGVQPIEPVVPEALLPANDGGRRGLELSLDRAERHAFPQHQNQLGAKHISGGQRTRLANSLVMVTLLQATSASSSAELPRRARTMRADGEHPIWHYAVRVARLGGYGASKTYRKAAASCQQKFPVPLTVPLKLRLARISTYLGGARRLVSC
jgi:hypothetical protein